MRRTQRLVKDVQRRLATVTVPSPFSLDALCDQLSHDRGRPVHLHQMPDLAAPGHPCGMWIATPSADHIFHARGSSPLHQQNIILHEIGHMLCDHTGRGSAAVAAGILPALDPAMVQRVLARTSYGTQEEEAAELAATLILERAGWPSAGTRPDGTLGILHDLF